MVDNEKTVRGRDIFSRKLFQLKLLESIPNLGKRIANGCGRNAKRGWCLYKNVIYSFAGKCTNNKRRLCAFLLLENMENPTAKYFYLISNVAELHGYIHG